MTTKISYAFWILFAGAMLPLGWLFFWDVINNSYPEGVRILMSFKYLDSLLLLLWPSSFFLLGDPTDNNIELRFLSIVANLFYYTILGWLVFLIHTKKRLVFILPIATFYIWWLWYIVL